MTSRLRLLVAAVAAACLLVTAPVAGAGVPIRILQVFVTGHGTITTVPRKLSCARTCRALFPRDQDLRVVAHPATGWRFVRWSGYCNGTRLSCSFELTSSHDCPRLCTARIFDVFAVFART